MPVSIRDFLMSLFRRRHGALSAQEGYNLWAASYKAENNPVKQSSNETLSGMISNLNGNEVLDLGCGFGYFCHVAESQGARRVTGIDISIRMLEEAKKNKETPLTQFLLARGEQLPFGNASFDVVICALVAGHIQTLDSLIAEISRVLRTGGVCLLSDFHPFNTLQGAKRTFAVHGKTYEIRHYLHPLDEYVHEFKRHSLSIEEMAEPRWNGTPLIFAIRGTKSSLNPLR